MSTVLPLWFTARKSNKNKVPSHVSCNSLSSVVASKKIHNTHRDRRPSCKTIRATPKTDNSVALYTFTDPEIHSTKTPLKLVTHNAGIFIVILGTYNPLLFYSLLTLPNLSYYFFFFFQERHKAMTVDGSTILKFTSYYMFS